MAVISYAEGGILSVVFVLAGFAERPVLGVTHQNG